MLFTSTAQYVVLLLLLIVGWLFGLASHPGGRKWRASYNEERANHSRYRKEVEAVTRARDERIAELERENAALRSSHNAGPSVMPAVASAAQPAVAPSRAEPESKRGWFAWSGPGDDLSRIRGLDADAEARLKAEGVTRFADLASLNDTDELALEQRLGLPAGLIQREQWREQAVLLADSRVDEHGTRFSPRA
jgi:predicted flap endonuclease-1-like 5' DNA nuclease